MVYNRLADRVKRNDYYFSELRIETMEGNLSYLAALGSFTKFGAKRLAFLIRNFGSAETVWRASTLQLVQSGLPESITAEFISYRSETSVQQIWNALKLEQVELVSLDSDRYPQLLKEISNPPYLLYLKGNLPPLGPALAVVGTRRVTSYGLRATKELIIPLARRGVNVISGLAQGVDAAAHLAALEENTYTAAVVAFGLEDCLIYPPHHKKLFHKILESGGGILSEFPLGAHPLPNMFPQRNRLIAGLARATLVIEAPEASGALSTASFALEWNREVLAVPGPITHPNHAGTNRLIQRGATLVTCAEDICTALNWKTNVSSRPSSANKLDPSAPEAHQPLAETSLGMTLTATEQRLWETLSEEQHINDLAKASGLPIGEVSASLTLMQIKGIVNALPGQRYERS